MISNMICFVQRYGKHTRSLKQTPASNVEKSLQVIPFEQAVAKIRVAAEAQKHSGSTRSIVDPFWGLKIPVFGGRSGLRIFGNSRIPPFWSRLPVIVATCSCMVEWWLHGQLPNIISTNRPFSYAIYASWTFQNARPRSKRCYARRSNYSNMSVYTWWNCLWMHLYWIFDLNIMILLIYCICIYYDYTFYIFIYIFFCLYWTMSRNSDSTFTLVPSVPQGPQLAGFPHHRTHGCADDTRRGDSVVGFHKWIYTDRMYDPVFLFGVVICDHFFMIFFNGL